MTVKQSPRPQRKATIRWTGHDYREPGIYFVTLCTQGRHRLFGDVTNNQMHLNGIGEMMTEMWSRIPGRYDGVELDAMVIMPDHLHGLLVLGTDPETEILPKLGDVIKYFKGISTHRYIKEYRQKGWPQFEQRIWQQRYNDRVVRSETELDAIRDYIAANPSHWEERENDNA